MRMMSRQHFDAVTNAIRDAVRNPLHSDMQKVIARRIALDIADAIEKLPSQPFNRARFLAACGVEP